MTYFFSTQDLKKYIPHLLIVALLGFVYLYFSLSKDIQHLDDHHTVVTNHWTGEVQRCVVTPDQKRACRPAESVAVPWYMAIAAYLRFVQVGGGPRLLVGLCLGARQQENKPEQTTPYSTI